MMLSKNALIAACAAAIVAAPVGAQLPKVKKDKTLPVKEWSRGPADVPPGHRPPAGMCRIWIDNVPPGRQPAPTDCATAVRTRPANGRVIYGSDYTQPGRSDEATKRDRDARTDDDDRRVNRDDRKSADTKAAPAKSKKKSPAQKKKPDDGKI